MKKINLQKHWPVANIQQNLVLMTNGNYGMAYQLDLPEVYSQSEKKFDDLHRLWFKAFKSLPVGVIIHKQDIYLEGGYNGDHIPGHTFLSLATRQYFAERKMLTHSSLLFFVWPKNKSFNHASISNPFKIINSRFIIEMNHQLKNFVQAVEESVAYLNNAREFYVSPLTEKEIQAHTSSYFNGFNEHQLTEVVSDSSQLVIGGNYFGAISINSELSFGSGVQTSRPHPKFSSEEISFHQGFIDMLGLEFKVNHVVNQIIFIDDRLRWLANLEKQRESLKKSIQFGSQNRVVLEKIERIIQKIQADDQSKIIRGQTGILCWDTDQKQLDRNLNRISGNLKELDITSFRPIGSTLFQTFLCGYYGFVSNIKSNDLYVVDLRHALCLWINNTVYKNDKAGIFFNDRLFNTPVRKDIWDEEKKRIKARNFAVFAPTGEGKSFLANNILRQLFENDTRLVIIDLGGSYTKIARLYPDDHIILKYEEGKSLGINPFYVEDLSEIPAYHIEDLAGFLLELTGQCSNISKEGYIGLKKHILHFYQNKGYEFSLEGFCQFLKGVAEKEADQIKANALYFDLSLFLHLLSEYRKGGIYDFLFENNKDQSYRLEQKRLIIFELDEVKDKREILAVMLKLIKSAVQRTIWKNKNERGIILFDEFAKQLKFENVLESVEFYYQAIRKQNGAVGIILQSVNQLPENATSASILENTQIIYSLNNEKGYESLKRRLNLSGHDLNQLNSIRNNLTGKRKYTEIFIKIGKESNVFRLEVPPEVWAAYLTDGKESQELTRLFKANNDMEKAIVEFLKQS